MKAKSSNSQINTLLLLLTVGSRGKKCAAFINAPFLCSFLLFLPDFFILLAQLDSGLMLSRAAGCFTGALSLPDRDNPRAGMLGQWQWLQMDAVSL